MRVAAPPLPFRGRRKQPATVPPSAVESRPLAALVVAGTAAGALLIGMFLSVSVGAADIDIGTVWRSVFAYNAESTDQYIIHDIRLPRVVAGVLVGACFAVAGAIMQALTRNPLAEPGLMGLNAGATLVVVIALAIDRNRPLTQLILLSFVGALLGTAIVYGVGSLSRGGLTPVKLALAGASVSVMLGSLTSGIVLYYGIAQDVLYFQAGGISGTTWHHVQLLLPWFVIGLIGALFISRSLTVLSLGDEVAQGLGLRTTLIKAIGSLVVLLLAGAAVAVAGPIGFIGLMIPHVTRGLVGLDYRWVIPCSALLGGTLLMFADVAARLVRQPYETPVGFVTALIGVPFFLYIARRDRAGL
jgi:iron complex transport system permease protein